MNVLINQERRILIQGITGREARMVAGHMIEYGSPLHAGVTPGRGGQEVGGVPVYDTVADAVAQHGIDTSLISVPPAAVLDACREAANNGITTIVVATEGVPQHDVLLMLEYCAARGVTVIGPNSVGVINPGEKTKIGAIGGEHPDRAFVPGRIGVISRSGGMTAELGLLLKNAGRGVSTAYSVGGDALIGTPPHQLLSAFENDANTDAVLYFGEPGTSFEEQIADKIAAGRFSKPFIAVIGGTFTESLPEGTAFGHAAAIIEGSSGRPSTKRQRIIESGGHIADRLSDIPALLQTLL